MKKKESVEKFMDRVREKEQKIEKFADLLDALESTQDKKKLLWKDVYENALEDRESAHILFTDLLLETRGSVTNHATFGSIMSKYLERMAKSNDQILKLAELVAKEEHNSINADDIFSQINNGE